MALAQANALRVLSTKVTFIISIRMPASTAAHAPMLALWELSILRNNNLYAKNSGCPHQAAFFVYLSEYSTSSFSESSAEVMYQHAMALQADRTEEGFVFWASAAC